MGGEWRSSTWGEEISLEYGKALRGHEATTGKYRVFGSNGPIGWTTEPLAPGPGVILGRKGAYRGVQYSPGPFYVIDTAYYVAPKTELDMRWLYYAIQHYKLGEVDDGSPIPSTTRAAVYVRGLEVPPPDEQRAIAHILGTLDDKIELNRRMNETLEAMARAFFKSWFVDFAPVHAKAKDRDPGLPKPLGDLFPVGLVDSELGEIPMGWSAVPLYDIATYVNGAAYAAFDPNEERRGLPIIKIAELKAGVTPQTRFSAVQMPEKYRISRGDILFSWSGNPDTSIDTFVWSLDAAWLNQHIFRVVPQLSHERAFVLTLLKHLRPVFAEIARNKQTTGLGHVTAADMKRLLVVRPDDRVMLAWDAIGAPLLDRTFLNEVEIRSVTTLRDTLLPKLVSGELRVEDAERIVGRNVQ
jgi:type I restriction enzyme S subunit